jgi:hypothetical protein
VDVALYVRDMLDTCEMKIQEEAEAEAEEEKDDDEDDQPLDEVDGMEKVHSDAREGEENVEVEGSQDGEGEIAYTEKAD